MKIATSIKLIESLLKAGSLTEDRESQQDIAALSPSYQKSIRTRLVQYLKTNGKPRPGTPAFEALLRDTGLTQDSLWRTLTALEVSPGQAQWESVEPASTSADTDFQVHPHTAGNLCRTLSKYQPSQERPCYMLARVRGNVIANGRAYRTLESLNKHLGHGPEQGTQWRRTGVEVYEVTGIAGDWSTFREENFAKSEDPSGLGAYQWNPESPSYVTAHKVDLTN